LVDDRQLYDRSYFIRGRYGSDPRRAVAYQRERGLILRRTQPGIILDVGCGTGDFLAGFDDRWEKLGIEVSDYAREIAGKTVKLVEFQELDDASVDVVVFRGTIQHISEPMSALFQATRVLKEGGLLAILATPNTDSLGFFRWKTLPALEGRLNWVPFGHRMLENILERLQYSAIEFSFPYGKPYARPFRNLLNFVIGRPDAFPGNMMEVLATRGR
jgi:ubiquinone/menaquinone biosynthesis C-methylase UbiE